MTDQPDHHLSKDGSSTLYSNQFDQYYHNPNGAISESRHVFFDAPGLSDHLLSEPEEVSILEVGFGTGLNFFLLASEYLEKDLYFPVHFYSVEAFPISAELSSKLNYARELTKEINSSQIRSIFSDLDNGMNTIRLFTDKELYLHLFVGYFRDFPDIDHTIDFIFHDAFSPEVNQELWQPETFSRLRSFSSPDTILSTYCAASKARAAMAKAGWYVSRAPGALGKREMTLASLNPYQLQHKRVNEQRLVERFDAGDFK